MTTAKPVSEMSVSELQSEYVLIANTVSPNHSLGIGEVGGYNRRRREIREELDRRRTIVDCQFYAFNPYPR